MPHVQHVFQSFVLPQGQLTAMLGLDCVDIWLVFSLSVLLLFGVLLFLCGLAAKNKRNSCMAFVAHWWLKEYSFAKAAVSGSRLYDATPIAALIADHIKQVSRSHTRYLAGSLYTHGSCTVVFH